MLPGMEMLACPNLAVSREVMQHIVQVESGANPYAIGVVDGQLVRQPRNMGEAVATAQMLESKGYNFSLGIAQVNRSNLGRYGLDSFEKAFNACNNLAAGAQILARCYRSAAGDWGKAFSCYYSGNFVTGFRDGYVQKVYASIDREAGQNGATALPGGPASEAIPLATATTTATTSNRASVSTDPTMLRPMVVYASNSAQYRVALRSVAIDAAAAAMMPLVVSAGDHLAHADNSSLSKTMTRQPIGNAIGQSAPTVTRDPGNQPPSVSTPNAQTASAAKISSSPTPDDGIFEPQVWSPNDPPKQSSAVAQGTAKPHADGADLRAEHTDAAFVF